MLITLTMTTQPIFKHVAICALEHGNLHILPYIMQLKWGFKQIY